jgi:hypothetical protein
MFKLAPVTISMSFVEVVAMMIHVSPSCHKKCDQFLDQQINIKYCQKLSFGDEIWCFQYDPISKQQSLQLKQLTSSQPNKGCILKSQIKTMLITFFNIKDIVHFEFIPQGQTISQAYYMEIPK